MAFTVQTDSTVIGANAYITTAFFDDYHAARGNDTSALTTSTAKEQAIVRATDYLDQRFFFIGERLNVDQSTEWPRYNAYDRDDNYVDGIPQAVKEACAEYALIAANQVLNPTPERDPTGRVVISKSEQVGPISESVRYGKGGSFEMPKYPLADQKLIRRGLIVRPGRLLRG